MSILKNAMVSAALAASLTAVSAPSAAALLFTANGGYGTSIPFDILQSNVDATSTYTSPIGPVASFDALIGRTDVGLTDTSSGGQLNGYLNGTTPLNSAQSGGLLNDYSLLFSYTLTGTASVIDGLGLAQFQDATLDRNGDGLIDSSVSSSGPCTAPSGFCGGDSILPNYTSGTITVTYRDNLGGVLGVVGGTQKILQLDLVSATPDGTNVVLFADVDYGWYTAGTSSLVENFFSFVNPVNGFTRWYDIWASGTALNPVQILTRSDFNIDPNAVPASTCADGANCQTFARTTNLNITTTAQVPEPGVLALLGIAFAGLGFARRGLTERAV